MCRTFAGCILILCSILGGEALAKDAWLELRTDNFIVHSDAGEEKARALIQELEWFREVIAALVGLDLSGDRSPPLRIYAFSRNYEYLKASGLDGTAGFYISTWNGPVSMLSLEEPDEKWQSTGRQVLFHEYTHHILHQFSRLRYPRWYDEGFAEYVSTIKFGDNGVVTLGMPPLERLAILKSFKWLSMRQLLESQGRYIQPGIMSSLTRAKNDQPVTLLQYSQGWLLTHYLQSDATRREMLREYLSLLNMPAMPVENALMQSFGKGFEEFEDELEKYWWDRKIHYLQYEMSDILVPVEIAIRQMDPVEADMQSVEGRYFAGADTATAQKAYKHFAKAYEKNIRRKVMAFALAEIAVDTDKPEAEVNKWLDAASNEGMPAATLSVLRARHVLSRCDKAKNCDYAGTALEAREQLRRAIEQSPFAITANLELAKTYLLKNETPEQEAFDGLDIVESYAPDLREAKIVRARLLARVGRYEEALEIILAQKQWTTSRQHQKSLDSLINEIKKDQEMQAKELSDADDA